MTFTKKQKKEYIDKHGNICPYCKSKGISYMDQPECAGKGKVEQEMECFACNKRWEDIYTLTNIIHEDDM